MARTRLSSCTALLIAAILLPRLAFAQCGASMSGRFGGEITAVAQLNAGNLLVAHGSEVEIYSLANPSAPAPYSPRRRAPLDAPAVKIAMTQGSSRAFVLLENGAVEVLTVSYSPLLSIGFPTTIHESSAVDVVADDQRVYIATLDEDPYDPFPFVYSWIDEYNLATSAPVFVRAMSPLTDQYGYDRIVKVGNVLWAGFHEVASSILGVDGFDVSNPANPVRTGAALTNALLGTYTRVTAMTAIGNNLLVSYVHGGNPVWDDNWLRAADVSVPTNPAWKPAVDLNGEAGCMSSIGSQLRISIKNSGIGTWDTSNPAALTWLGAYFDSFPDIKQMVSVAGTDYWAAGRSGLMTMNTTNPAVVSLRSTPIVPLPTGPHVVRQRGNTSVVLDYTLNVLRLFDYTLPEAQQLRSTVSLPSGAELLELADLSGGTVGLACVATQYGASSITIIDITNPAAPVVLSTISGFTASLMSASGSRLYVFTTANDFKIIELAQPLAPQIRSTTHFGGISSDYTCMTSWSNNAAAIGTTPFGLWLMDTTNATAPFVASIWNPVSGYRVNSVAKGTNYLYVSATVGSTPTAISDTRLESLNVATITSPTLRFVDNSTSGTGYPGEFASLRYVSSPAAKFLVGVREDPNSFSTTPWLSNDLTIFELPPGFLTNEGVPFPVATMDVPYGRGGIAPNADGSRFLLAGEEAGLYQVAMPASWAPGFGTRPFDQRPCIGGTASFVAFASGNPTSVTYQWYRDGVAMTDGITPWGTTIAGSTNSVLEFTNIHTEDAWISTYTHHIYRCIATNSCGSTTSPFGTLTTCYANCDCSTAAPILNVNDFSCFLNKFAAGDPLANCDGSTTSPLLNVNDFQCFLNAYAAGCP